MTLTQRLLMLLASATPGLRRLRRPASGDTPAFDLAYVRTGPRTATPTVVIPGGPGLGTVLPYRGMRRMAARGGLDLIMIEHRGVGLSRADVTGADLPSSAMRVTAVLDDIAAVLDHEGVEKAFVAGSSYGSYLASAFGVRHAERVAGMLLDSALQSGADLPIERRAVRGVFWEADSPLATTVQRLVEAGEDQRILLDIARAAYELDGTTFTRELLRHRVGSRSDLAWKLLRMYATRDDSIARIPGFYEFDLAGVIGFRELHYGAPMDGLPMDPATTYAPIAPRFPVFAGESFDLTEAVRSFAWPLAVLSGTRDLRTPPEIAQRVVDRSPDSILVSIENGHSALDTHPVAFLNVIRQIVRKNHRALATWGPTLDRLPKRGLTARLPQYLRTLLRLERGNAEI